MEFRWLTTDEKRTRAVEVGSLPEVLALAQKLQSEGSGLVAEDEVVEMGRELGAERDQGLALVVIGRALAQLGERDTARERLGEARELFERLALPNAADVTDLLAELNETAPTAC